MNAYVRNLGRRSEQAGFSLVELLVVIIILGVLATIALPSFLSQRVKGWDAAAKSDSRNMAKVALGLQADGVVFDGTLTFQDFVDDGYNTSSGVDSLFCVGATVNSFAVATSHEASTTVFVVDPEGRLTESVGLTLLAAAAAVVDGGNCAISVTGP